MNSRKIAIATMIGLLFVEVAVMSFALGQPEDRTTDEDVALIESKLEKLNEMPEMKISGWAMHTDEKEVVIWVYGFTPENQQLDDKIIDGWKLIVAQSPIPADQNKSREIAKDYLLNSSTFRFDGIEDSLMLVEANTLKCPYCWEFVLEFQCRHAGYGNRTGQILAQVITPHTARIIVEQGRVTSAIMDGKWNMLEQRMIDDFYTYSSLDATPSVQWNKTFGGKGSERVHSIRQTPDGGYILAGETDSYGNGLIDAWLIKTYENGTEEWHKIFGGMVQDYAYSVQQTADGGYILAGETVSFGSGNYDAWLIKTDTNGKEQWNKTFGGAGLDCAKSAQQISDGGYVLAGYTRPYEADYEDAWLVKTDANGDEQWNKTYGETNSSEGAYSVQQTSDGGYILAGYTGYFYGAKKSDAWLIKTDANGNEQWNKTFGGINHFRANAVVQTLDGGYIISGESISFEADESDAWLIKTDSDGNEQWKKTFRGINNYKAYSVGKTSDGGYIIAGEIKSYGAYESDAWLVKTDSTGKEEWSMALGGKSSSDSAYSVLQTKDGDYVLAGWTYPNGESDAWLIKVSSKVSITTTSIPTPTTTVTRKLQEFKHIPSVEEWNRTFGGTNDDWVRSVRQTSDGGYILAGYTGVFEAGEYAWLIKTDTDGNELWNKTFSRGADNIASSVQQTSDGGYILSGYTRPDGGDYNAWLIKTDINGNEQWNRTFGEKIYSWACSVQQTSDGGYTLAGFTRSQRIPWGENDFDAWLIKTDINGNEQWNRTFGGTNEDRIISVQQTLDGGYVLAGYTNSYRSSWGDAWLIKTDIDGNEQWNRTYYEVSFFYQATYSVQETSDGGFIIAGVIMLDEADPGDAWIIKTDTNGNEQWNRTFGGTNADRAHSVQQTSDGGYIMAGDMSSNGAADAWIIKTDTKGNEQWNRTFRGKFMGEANSVVLQTSDGGYVLAGETVSYRAADLDIWLIKVSTEVAPAIQVTPGFEAVFAIIGLLPVIYLLRRRE